MLDLYVGLSRRSSIISTVSRGGLGVCSCSEKLGSFTTTNSWRLSGPCAGKLASTETEQKSDELYIPRRTVVRATVDTNIVPDAPKPKPQGHGSRSAMMDLGGARRAGSLTVSLEPKEKAGKDHGECRFRLAWPGSWYE
mmetsp:Transcript_5676/g.10426  ORF Transcript_5676/g.10426 Transcript_5676/m.10426 type:complete len:139 (+) Transcript_5676:1659-2075(+)